MKQAPAHTLLFTDDFSRAALRPPLLRRLLEVIAGRSIAHLARSLAPGSLVVSGEEAAGALFPAGVSRLSYGTVLIQGVTGASAAELVRFAEAALEVIKPVYQLKSKSGVTAADVLAFRHLATFLQEYVLRSVAPIDRLLGKLAPRGVAVTGAGSQLEKIAARLARRRGIPVEELQAPIAYRLASRLKAKLTGRHAMPDYEAIRKQWAAFGKRSETLADPAGSSTGGTLIVCEEERRLERAAELLHLVAGRGLILSVPFKEEGRKKAEQMRAGGLPVTFLPAFLDEQGREEVYSRAVREGETAWARLVCEDSLQSFSYLGVPVLEVFGEKLKVGWHSLNLVAALSVAAAEECLDRVKPSRVIVVDNGIYAKAMQAVAKARGIPVLWYSDNPILCNTTYWPELIRAFFPFDGVIASSAFIMRGMREKFGFPAERVFLLGAPEKTGTEAPLYAATFNKRAGAVLSLSTYVTMDVSAETRKRFHLLVAGAAKIAGLDLVVRAHPNESLEGLRADLESWGIQPSRLSQKENIQEALAGVDLACMIFSQAGLEVLRGGKPLVVVQEEAVSEGYEAFVPYVGAGAALGVDPLLEKPAALAEKFKLLVAGPEKGSALARGREFFRQYSTGERDPAEVARLLDYLSQR